MPRTFGVPRPSSYPSSRTDFHSMTCRHGKRCQTKGCPGLSTTLQLGISDALHMALAVKAEFTTGAWTVWVDGAANGQPDLALQGHATGLLLIGAFHATAILRLVLGQCLGHIATLGLVCLAPVERNPEPGTASTTLQTRILTRHHPPPNAFVHPAKQARIRRPEEEPVHTRSQHVACPQHRRSRRQAIVLLWPGHCQEHATDAFACRLPKCP